MIEYFQQILDTLRVFLWISLAILSVAWIKAVQNSSEPLLLFFPEYAKPIRLIIKWVPIMILVVVLLLFFLPSAASLQALLT